MPHFGRVSAKPDASYAFVDELVDGQVLTRYLHVTHTQEGSLGDYSVGSVVAFEVSRGPKGWNAEGAWLTTPEAAETAGAVLPFEEIVATDVVGTVLHAFNDKGFTFIEADGRSERVFLHFSSLADVASAAAVIKGTR